MHNSTQILSSIQEEITIIKHLFGKVTPEQMSYKPGENMRTMEELLRYITYTGVSVIQWHKNTIEGEDSKGLFPKYTEQSNQMDMADFPKVMDRQYDEIAAILTTYTEDDLKNKQCKTFAGTDILLGEATINTALKYLTAYRMQLFLYLKQAGHSDLSTWNCWLGIEKPVK